MKKLIVSLFGLVLGVILILNISFYGSIKNWLARCEYTEEIIKNDYVGFNIIFTKSDKFNGYVLDERSICTTSLKDTTKSITNVKNKNHMMSTRDYDKYELDYDQAFTLINEVVVQKHGLSTIDSGSSPMVYLVIKDKEGTEYRIYQGTILLINNNTITIDML